MAWDLRRRVVFDFILDALAIIQDEGTVERLPSRTEAPLVVTAAKARKGGLDQQFVRSLTPAQVGAAPSEVLIASIDDIVIVPLRSHVHSRADIERTQPPRVRASVNKRMPREAA